MMDASSTNVLDIKVEGLGDKSPTPDVPDDAEHSTNKNPNKDTVHINALLVKSKDK